MPSLCEGFRSVLFVFFSKGGVWAFEDLTLRRGGKRLRMEYKASLTPVSKRPGKRQWTTHRAREAGGLLERTHWLSVVLRSFRVLRMRVRVTVRTPATARLWSESEVQILAVLFINFEASILKQCNEQASRVLLLAWLGAGWSFFPIVLRKLSRDQGAVLNRLRHLERSPAQLLSEFGYGQEIVGTTELESALLEAFEEAASSESESESADDSD